MIFEKEKVFRPKWNDGKLEVKISTMLKYDIISLSSVKTEIEKLKIVDEICKRNIISVRYGEKELDKNNIVEDMRYAELLAEIFTEIVSFSTIGLEKKTE